MAMGGAVIPDFSGRSTNLVTFSSFLLISSKRSLSNTSFGYRASVAGAVIQATGTVEFEDGLRTGVFQEDCWCPYSGRITLESDMARPWRLALTLV